MKSFRQLVYMYILGIRCTNILKQKKSGLGCESSLFCDDDWYSLSRNDFLPVYVKYSFVCCDISLKDYEL